jgi:hypothetical protein
MTDALVFTGKMVILTMAENRIIIVLIKGLEWLDMKLKKTEKVARPAITTTSDPETFLEKPPENDFRAGVRKQNQRLTTLIGKVLDRATYLHIGAWILGIIFICALLYTWIGSSSDTANFGDYLYFSVITFTSLGYGDIAPVGIGKLVASIEVFFGLITVAIFVGKVASERQAALLTLVYTSEHHRRITSFTESIKSLNDKVLSAFNEYDNEQLIKESQSAYRFVSSLHNYLMMQSHQGQIATIGNISTLRRLYKNLTAFQLTCIEAVQTYGINAQTLTELSRVASKINTIAVKMSQFHTGDQTAMGKLDEIQTQFKTLNSWKKKRAENKIDYKHRTHLTENLLLKIADIMAEGYQPEELVEKVAEKLSITKSLVRRGIAQNIAKLKPEENIEARLPDSSRPE